MPGACALFLISACDPAPREAGAGEGEGGVTALTGARLVDGTGGEVVEDGVSLLRDGRVLALGTVDDVMVPSDARHVDVSGRAIIPGIINAHGHVGMTRGLSSSSRHYTRENISAHSVRDRPVDDELIDLMAERDICITPTPTRELSTFVYASRPDFFDNPFFLREAHPEALGELEDPERQRQVRESPAAAYYREALPLAQANMRALAHAGIRIALGTDSGPPARFQGYFEHVEMEMMAEAEMTAAEIIVAATGDAARCMGIADEIGTLEIGKWADFIVLSGNPLDDISNARRIESVWIAGASIDR